MNVDWVRCYYPLPEEMAQGITFQTQDLPGLDITYEISQEGQLILPRYDENNKLLKKTDVLWNGPIFMYGYAHYLGSIYFCYEVTFNQGEVKRVIDKRLEHQR